MISAKTLGRWTMKAALASVLLLGAVGCRVVGGTASVATPVTIATPTLPPLMKIVTPTPAPAATPGSQPPAPAQATQPAAPAANGTYVVQAGDTLYVIAARLNVSMQALAAANNITNPSSLQVGQVLKVPAPAKP